MQRTAIQAELSAFPQQFHPLLRAGRLFDSSSSPNARVWFLETGCGYFLKAAAAGSLKGEADMTGYFHTLGLGPEVLAYESDQQDWLLTAALPGEDCLHPACLAEPKRLCDITAQLLRSLHDTVPVNCPIPNRTARNLAAAQRNYANGRYDSALFPDNWGYRSPEEAFRVIETQGKYLQNDTLLHGDYCLPNIILQDWQFRGFIDLAAGGIGDRHMDLFWGIWSLGFNLHTDRYRDRFLDAYGRNQVNEDALRVVAALEVFR